MGLVEDFTDDMFEGRQLSSTLDANRTCGENGDSAPAAWPLEDLAARAHAVEEELKIRNAV